MFDEWFMLTCLLVCLFVLGRGFEPREEKALIPVFAVAALGLWSVVTFGVVAGVIITSVRGV